MNKSSSRQLIYKLYFCKVESRKAGQIDKFWLKSLHGLRPSDVMEKESINAENLFLSCDLSCDGV